MVMACKTGQVSGPHDPVRTLTVPTGRSDCRFMAGECDCAKIPTLQLFRLQQAPGRSHQSMAMVRHGAGRWIAEPRAVSPARRLRVVAEDLRPPQQKPQRHAASSQQHHHETVKRAHQPWGLARTFEYHAVRLLPPSSGSGCRLRRPPTCQLNANARQACEGSFRRQRSFAIFR